MKGGEKEGEGEREGEREREGRGVESSSRQEDGLRRVPRGLVVE